MILVSTGERADTMTFGGDHPCHGHVADDGRLTRNGTAETADPASSTGHVMHATCSACDVCHTVAIDMLVPTLLQPIGSQTVSMLRTERFFSSELRRDRKPPIV